VLQVGDWVGMLEGWLGVRALVSWKSRFPTPRISHCVSSIPTCSVVPTTLVSVPSSLQIYPTNTAGVHDDQRVAGMNISALPTSPPCRSTPPTRNRRR